MQHASVGARLVLARNDFPAFVGAIRHAGYRLLGPTVRDGAIVYGELERTEDLPVGWTDHQEPGKYRLEKRKDEALFGYTVGPQAWKKVLFPSHERLWTAQKNGSAFTVAAEPVDPRPVAFLGMRACELAALSVTDRVFLGQIPDPGYSARRQKILRIAVQCGQAGGTCFCTSMGTGPAVTSGFDLKLTEILSPGAHRFLLEVGTEAGAEVVKGVPVTEAPGGDVETAHTIVSRTAASMGRTMDTTGIRDLLINNPEHPRWEIVAKRCLACTNCTMVCPTCFCHTTEEVPDLSGEKTERWRRWDSCFNLGFTALHTGSVRTSTKSRYRQWMTHKLASWHDQFGTSGCVGCGRCITWCPVGIDITEEVAAIRASPGATKVAEVAR